MLLVVLVIASVSAMSALGRWWLVRSRAQAMNVIQREVETDIEQRLKSIPAAYNGSVVPGPALETLQGKLSLSASKAPQSWVIDSSKFTVSIPTTLQLTVARVEDAKKIISTKGLRKLIPEDSELAKSHLFFATDEAFGRRCMEPSFVDLLRTMDAGVRGRCRLTLARGTATVWLERGLSKTEELTAFYDGSVALMVALRERLGPAA
jgi:hypothetical protein